MNWVHYILQVNIFLTLSYAFYWFVIKNETFFQINRAFLLSSSILAILIPFWNLGILQSFFITTQVSEVVNSPIQKLNITATEALNGNWNWYMILVSIYFVGFGYGLLKFSIDLFKLQRLLKVKNLKNQAFSIFGKIIIDKNLPDYHVIHSHEEVHSRQFHSVDVFWMELVRLTCWFNPILHYMSNEIKVIHEYIADERASKINGKINYAELLVATHFNTNTNQLINNFYNKSILRTRIEKLSQQKSSKRALIKYTLIIPLFTVFLIFSAAGKASSFFNYDKVNQEKQNSTSGQLPEFPGGLKEMYKFIGQNIIYPESAQKNRIEGQVFIRFIVKKDGSLDQFEILKGIGYGCDDETLRVFEAMPNWIPVKNNGEATAFQYTTVVSFQLD